MNMNKSNVTKWNDVLTLINQILQVLALLTAGAWAYWNWSLFQADKMDTGLNIDPTVKKTWLPHLGLCEYDITVQVDNPGNKTVEIASDQYVIYEAAFIELPDETQVHVGSIFSKEREEVEVSGFSDSGFSLPPGEDNSSSFSVFARPSKTKGYAIKYNYFDEDDFSVVGFSRQLEPCLPSPN